MRSHGDNHCCWDMLSSPTPPSVPAQGPLHLSHPRSTLGLNSALGLNFTTCTAMPCPQDKAQQQSQKHPMSHVLSYGEWRQHAHARNSNNLPLHRNTCLPDKISLEHSEHSLHVGICRSLPALRHPPRWDQVAAAGLHRSAIRPCRGTPLIKRWQGARAGPRHGPPPCLCHVQRTRRK